MKVYCSKKVQKTRVRNLSFDMKNHAIKQWVMVQRIEVQKN
jgi:hypothetical protein